MDQEIQTKECSKCHQIKIIIEFTKDKNRKLGIKNYCKQCDSLQQKMYQSKNRDEINRRRRIKYHINPTKIKYRNNKWRYDNPTKIANYELSHKTQRRINHKKYTLKKYNTDPIYKLNHLCRTTLSKLLKGTYKKYHTSDYIGCNMIIYKTFLEKQFYNNMIWNNRGSGINKWQIHHICPLEYFDITDPIEQKQAYHYTNTQPLWYEDHCEIHRKINERMSQYENGGKPVK